ncbi:MAG: helix-turn-helix transcriptional regulator [Candidatus Aminicenantes bacterium]|nr:helix-turn-helix transcriptional regulator [Candidatus Aminicenantes bacterium]
MKIKFVAVAFFILFNLGYASDLYPETPNTAMQLIKNIKNKKFTGEAMDFDFENTDLQGIFQKFETISGQHFKVDSELHVVRKFTFKGVEWDKALYLILLNLELELQWENGFIRVKKAQPQTNRLSIFFLSGVLSALFAAIFVFILIHQAKKRKKTKQMDNKFPLPEDYVKKIRKRLYFLFDVEKIYQDEYLSLHSLADSLNIPPHQLSWIMNYKMGKSFSGMVNHYRIEDVKKRLSDFKYRNKTILEIAYSSGFNTKSAFNKTFKVLTGKTPKEYRMRNNPRAS